MFSPFSLMENISGLIDHCVGGCSTVMLLSRSSFLTSLMHIILSGILEIVLMMPQPGCIILQLLVCKQPNKSELKNLPFLFISSLFPHEASFVLIWRMKFVPCSLQTGAAVHVAGCCRAEWEGRGGKGEVGDIHAHLWWAAISWPSNGALEVLHHGKEKDSDPCQSISAGGWIQGRLVVHSQPSGCWCVSQLQRNLSHCLSFSLSMCVCVKCLPSSFHCCRSGCSQGCGRHSLCLVSSADITPKGWFGGRLG